MSIISGWRINVFLLLLLLFLSPEQVNLANDNWLGQTYDKAYDRFVQGDYDKAANLLQETVDRAQATELDDASILESLRLLAETRCKQGKYKESEELFVRCLKALEQTQGTSCPAICFIVDYVGTICMEQGRFAESEMYFKRALSLAERTQGAQHWTLVGLLTRLAESLIYQGRYSEAGSYLERANSIVHSVQLADKTIMAHIFRPDAIHYNKTVLPKAVLRIEAMVAERQGHQ